MKRLPKGALAWAFYDWANSAFVLTVLTAFYGPLFKYYWAEGNSRAFELQGMTAMVAGLIVGVAAPLLGALADAGGARKKSLGVFASLGLVACAGLPFVAEGDWKSACLLYVVGSVGFYGANIFYDSLLPDVSGEGDRHVISGLGFAMGYLGSVLLFAAQCVLVSNPGLLGLGGPLEAMRVCVLMVGAWWLVFSLPLFMRVREPRSEKAPPLRGALRHGLRELRAVVVEILTRRRALVWFLAAYWFYIDGVNTIAIMTASFAAEVGVDFGELLKALVVAQLVGVPCALLFGWLGQKFGPKPFILLALVVYMGVTAFATRLDNTPLQFLGLEVSKIFVMAMLIGSVQGGVQALSRSLYAGMVPEEASAAYFGLYNLVGKGAAIMGPPLLTLGGVLTGDARQGAMAVAVLFLIGGLLLVPVREQDERHG